jgi:hypothetical protein
MAAPVDVWDTSRTGIGDPMGLPERYYSRGGLICRVLTKLGHAAA